MKKLNPEIKKKWLTALKSGNYKQGTGKLRRRDNSFCCLGVLCDISGIQWTLHSTNLYWQSAKTWSIGMPYRGDLDEETFDVLSQSFNKNFTIFWHLADLNDQSETGFDPTIKYIEKNL